jgi:hypothetical protein
MASCRLCSQEILFSDLHVSPLGRKIPLDPNERPHKCSVWLAQHIKYKKYSKGCGADVYWDEKQKSINNRWVPIDKNTGFTASVP